MTELEAKHNKALIILGMKYPYLDTTQSPELFFYKEESDYTIGLVDIAGNVLVKSILPSFLV